MIRKLPLIKIDFGYNYLAQEGYKLWFLFAPWPAIEQRKGMLIQALIAGSVWFRPRWPYVQVQVSSSDPADRPIGEHGPPAHCDVEDWQFNPSKPIQIILDGKPLKNAVAYDLREGWAEQITEPKFDGKDWVWGRERKYGDVEAGWL